ncbi:MAG: transposase [Acidobacteriota bacterium]|nr:transposase [Acidobacteriota bacterium]
MARFSRVVVPGVPHHVTQRGARRMQVFFSRDDYRAYSVLLARQARRHALEIWAYCLMPNHCHLVAVPSTEEGLARPLGEAHRRYALRVNRRHGWTGHLWQERFSSFPMDEAHLMAAIRYVLLNPVRAGLAETATSWPYSSARAQVLGKPDQLVNPGPVAERVSDWDEYLSRADCARQTEALERHERIGRPLGSDDFIKRLERITGRRLRPRKVGRKRTAK